MLHRCNRHRPPHESRAGPDCRGPSARLAAARGPTPEVSSVLLGDWYGQRRQAVCQAVRWLGRRQPAGPLTQHAGAAAPAASRSGACQRPRLTRQQRLICQPSPRRSPGASIELLASGASSRRAARSLWGRGVKRHIFCKMSRGQAAGSRADLQRVWSPEAMRAVEPHRQRNGYDRRALLYYHPPRCDGPSQRVCSAWPASLVARMCGAPPFRKIPTTARTRSGAAAQTRSATRLPRSASRAWVWSRSRQRVGRRAAARS